MMITLKMALIVGVGIVAVGGIVTGIVFAVIGDSCEVFSAPSDINFEMQGNKLVVKWKSPENLNDCTIKYKLLVTVDGEDLPAIETEEEQYKIEEEIAPCTPIKLTLTAINDSEEESDGITKEYKMGVGDVSKVTVKDIEATVSEKGWIIKWEKPESYEICGFTYKITIGENIIIDEEHTIETIEISNDKFVKCKENSVKVQPNIQGSDGKEDTITFFVSVDDVSEVTIKGIIPTLSQNGWIIKWEKPKGYESCTIEYKVTVGDKIVSEAGNTETQQILNEDLETCKENTVKIQPKIQGKDGKEEKITVIGVGDVFQVTVKGLDKIESQNGSIIIWEKPDEYKDCDFTYKITVGENTIINQIHTTETIEISNDKLNTCEDNIVTVQPKIEGYDGKADTITVFGGVGDVSRVIVKRLDKTPSQNGWILNWEKPDGYEECKFTYRITLGENGIINEAHTQETIEISNDKLNTCRYNIVRVQPKIEGSDGKAAPITLRGDPMSIGEVQNGKIEVSSETNLVKVSWAKPDGLDICDFTYNLLVLKKSDGEEIAKHDKLSTNEWEDNVADIVLCEDLVAKVTAVYHEKSGTTTEISECTTIDEDRKRVIENILIRST